MVWGFGRRVDGIGVIARVMGVGLLGETIDDETTGDIVWLTGK